MIIKLERLHLPMDIKGLFLRFLKTPRFVWHVAEQSFLFADSLVYVTGLRAAVHQMALSNWVLFLGCSAADADGHITACSRAVCCTPSRSPTEREETSRRDDSGAGHKSQSSAFVGQLPRIPAREGYFKVVFASH